ncbi:MAG TPA: formimidoylglutamate deiminase [Anaeromyxobacteraceae bacterium]|nr:formimidoylglutamate deiminase [Anaeromyxobacteraceae bacterium]
MAAARAYLPDLVWSEGAFRAGAAVTVEDGKVAAVGPPGPGAEVIRWPGLAVLPGFVSAHSHAFQRAIRGRTERRAGAGRETFWTWRAVMYQAAARLGPDELHAVARMCFREMALAGITAVGEFHYLHRDPQGRPYQDPSELALRVTAAAREVGLRIVVLRAAYARGGAGRAPDAVQRRFVEASPDEVLAGLDRLSAALAGDPLASVGLAPHSVRACPAEWIAALAAEAGRRRIPLHVHAAEQPAEIEACREEHGTTPVGLLEQLGALSERTTAIHAIHLDDADVRALGRARVTVCACPTTERDLGDGIVPADRLAAHGVRLALGTDSNVQIDPMEDARALEQHLRLQHLERAVLDDPPGSLAPRLLAAATSGGMAALGLPGGRLAPGEPADLVAIALDDFSIAGAAPEHLAAAVVFSLARTAVRHVLVAGEAAVLDGRGAPGRTPDDRVLGDFREAMGRLWTA